MSGLGPEAATLHLDPSCRVGKHGECRGDAWSLSGDKPIDCACPCHRVTEPPC